MKQKKQLFKPYGLRARFVFSIITSALICGFFFCGLYYSTDYFLTRYFEQSDFEEKHIKKQGESLQQFINDNNISSEDFSKLKEWERRQPMILLELYSDDACIYSSFYDVYEDKSSRMHNEPEFKREEYTVAITLADMSVNAVMHSDFTYRYYIFRTAFSIIASLILFLIMFLRSNQKLIHYICRLNAEVQILEGGNLEYEVSVEGNDEITELAKSMNRMRKSFQQQHETEQQLHQANKKLITEMSHDLRTPLTGMMLYIEILRTHRYKNDEELQDYLEKIDAKAHQMKLISDHLFEYSLENVTERQDELLSMEQAFGKTVNGFIDELTARGFTVSSEIKWSPCFVQIKSEYINRIFENVISNIVKYAENSAEIRIETIASNGYSGFSIMNTCSAERGQVDSNGIGIKSIRSMIKQMGGICTVEQTDTIFEITFLFPEK